MAITYNIYTPTAARTNLITNPSVETNTTSWTAGANWTASKSAAQQYAGAHSLLLTASASPNVTMANCTITGLEASSAYMATAWIYVPAWTNGGTITLNTTLTDDVLGTAVSWAAADTGVWHQIRRPFTTVTDVTGDLTFIASIAPATAETLYIDAVTVVKTTAVETYIDGDRDGCYWVGQPHASTSVRRASFRGGGKVNDIKDLGFNVAQMQGAGAAEVDNVLMPFGQLDGALWQSTKTRERIFSLSAQMDGSTLNAFMAKRKTFIDALMQQQTGNDGYFLLEVHDDTNNKRVTLPVFYDGGMDLGVLRGFSEIQAIRLLAPDPTWRDSNEEGGEIATTQDISGTEFVERGADMNWTNNGAQAAGVDTTVLALSYSGISKNLYVGQSDTTNPLYYWDGSSWAAANDGTGEPDHYVYSLAHRSDGLVYVGGYFDAITGTSYAEGIALWNEASTGTWSAIGGGGVETNVSGANTAGVFAILVYGTDNDCYVGGNFPNAIEGSGTPAAVANTDAIAFYDRDLDAWSALGSGGVFDSGTAGTVYALAKDASDNLIVGGNFTHVNGSGATAAANIAKFTVSTGTWSAFASEPNALVRAMWSAPNGDIYVGGDFTSIGSDTHSKVARWTGQSWETLGSGITGGDVYSISGDGEGNVYISGDFTGAGGKTLQVGGVCVYRNGDFFPLDIDPGGTGIQYAIKAGPNQRVAIGGAHTSPSKAAGSTSITSTGTAKSWPIIKIRETGASDSVTISRITNVTTGQSIFFNNLTVRLNETYTLDLRPGSRSFRSDFDGDAMHKIAAGSSLSTFSILPGANDLRAFMAGSGTAEVSIYWQPRHFSVDGVS